MTYRQIADDITARVASGEYPAGAKIPSYSQLAALYSVSVATVQRAVMILHATDVVYGEPGRGVYVKGTT